MTDYDERGIADGLGAPYAVEFHETLGSSNDRAREIAADAPETVVVADEQTSPRGREGREWSSPAGGVWFSLLIDPEVQPAETPAYTLAMAVAVTEASREAGVEARIKWPNDVLVGRDGARGGRKLCGILTETVRPTPRADSETGVGQEPGADRESRESERDESAAERPGRRLVIGVGWNVNVDSADLPVADATSLRAELGRDVDRTRLLQRALELFHEARGDLRGALDRWRDLSDTLGRRVRVETPDGPVVGEAVDVVFPGGLRVRTDDGEDRVITAGDCDHLRPVG